MRVRIKNKAAIHHVGHNVRFGLDAWTFGPLDLGLVDPWTLAPLDPSTLGHLTTLHIDLHVRWP